VLWVKLTAVLGTRFDVPAATIRKALPKELQVTEYGRVRQPDGDKIQACELVAPGADSRDMSFIRVSTFIYTHLITLSSFSLFFKYQLLVDKYAHVKRKKPEFELRNFFGQLLRIFVVDVPVPLQGLQGAEGAEEPDEEDAVQPTQWIYAVIRSVKITETDSFSINYYEEMGEIEIVDLEMIQCVIGRIRDRNRWAIVDRSQIINYSVEH
jgi:hypothetical protein